MSKYVVVAAGAAALLSFAACGKPPCDPHHDMAEPQEMGMMPRPDLSNASDMSGTKDMAMGGDMAHPDHDMANTPDMTTTPDMAGPHVTGLPTCTDVGVTADTLYTDVLQGGCGSMGRCHNSPMSILPFTSGAEFKAATVGKASKQTTVINLVTGSNLDRSYLMYKLADQQLAAGGSGTVMPKAGRLADPALCKVITWIKEGAK